MGLSVERPGSQLQRPRRCREWESHHRPPAGTGQETAASKSRFLSELLFISGYICVCVLKPESCPQFESPEPLLIPVGFEIPISFQGRNLDIYMVRPSHPPSHPLCAILSNNARSVSPEQEVHHRDGADEAPGQGGHAGAGVKVQIRRLSGRCQMSDVRCERPVPLLSLQAPFSLRTHSRLSLLAPPACLCLGPALLNHHNIISTAPHTHTVYGVGPKC